MEGEKQKQKESDLSQDEELIDVCRESEYGSENHPPQEEQACKHAMIVPENSLERVDEWQEFTNWPDCDLALSNLGTLLSTSAT